MGRMINIDELWKELEILYDAKNGEVSWNDALWKIKSAPVVESNAQQWIPCSECVKYIDERCMVANRHVSASENCMIVFGAKRAEPWKGEQS